MRAYLFKGKREDTGEWVYGSLISVGNYHCILPEDDGSDFDYPYLDNLTGCIDGYAIPIDPSTMSQFTGLLDKDDKKIFEGDIIEYSANEPAIEVYMTGIVIFANGEYVGLPCVRKGRDSRIAVIPIGTDKRHVKVIGSIYDDPEVLKGE